MTENNKSGRPRLSETEETVWVHARVTESQREFLRRLGNGNVSEGLRGLVNAAQRFDEIVRTEAGDD